MTIEKKSPDGTKQCAACGAECPPKAVKCWLCKRSLIAPEGVETKPHVLTPSARTDALLRPKLSDYNPGELTYALACGLVIIVGIGLACQEQGWGYLLLYVPVATAALAISRELFQRYVAYVFAMLLLLIVIFSLGVAFLVSCLAHPLQFGGAP